MDFSSITYDLQNEKGDTLENKLNRYVMRHVESAVRSFVLENLDEWHRHDDEFLTEFVNAMVNAYNHNEHEFWDRYNESMALHPDAIAEILGECDLYGLASVIDADIEEG